jgi:Uma2 family endonuclease
MFRSQYPLSPVESLPTMYDLPSENPEEPGLPDEFHDYQPKLLRETCQPKNYPPEEVFIGTDLNVYYDVRHTKWYKRPDWFLALGVTVAERIEDLRWSYVVWQEGVNPFVVVELLSPGTEDEDLGEKLRELGKPPMKWEVYERILRVPFYVVFDRYAQQLRVFVLEQARYRSVDLPEPRYWFEPLELGIGVWFGTYQGIEGQWLRWYDSSGVWIPTAAERAQQETLRANQEALRANQEALRANQEALRADQEAEARRSAVPRLLAMGLTRSQVAEALGLRVEDLVD